jgi:hypothetical protein
VKRLVKILAMTMLLATILVLSLTGTVFAANGQTGNGNQGEECPYGDCDNQDCEPKAYSCNYSYEYESPGPHGQKNMTQNGALTQAGNGAQNQYQKGKATE